MNNRTNNNFSLRKLLIAALAVGPLAVLPAPLWALPGSQAVLDATIATKSNGVTAVLTSTNLVTVTSPDRGIIAWSDFGSGNMSINNGDTVFYSLPGASSSFLNRVVGNSPSVISGSIQSNGRVFILNPNGVTLNTGATVSAAAFGVSSIPEPDGNFTSTGSPSFQGNPSAPVSSSANISTLGGTGDVFIAGTNVNVAGTIAANNLNIRGGNTSANTITLGSGAALSVGTIGAGTTGNINITSNGANVITGATGGGIVTIVGNLIVNTSNVSPSTTGGAVTLSQGFNTSIASGNLTVTTGGGAVDLANGATTQVFSGNATVDTRGVSVNGAVTTTLAGGIVANAASRTLSVVAGGNSATPASISLNGDFTTVTVNGGNTFIRDTGGSLALGNSTIASPGGTALTVQVVGNALTSSGTLALSTSGGVPSAVSITTNSNAALVATGAISFADLRTTNTANISVTTTGDITTTGATTVGNAGATNELSLNATGGKLTVGNLTMSSTTTLTAGSDITLGSATGGDVVFTVTSSGGRITAGAISSSTATMTASGDITIGDANNPRSLTLTSSTGRVVVGNMTGNTATISASGDITVGNATRGRAFTLTSSGGRVTTGNLTTDTATITASGDVTIGNAIHNRAMSLTSSTGRITAGTLTTQTATITAAGDISIGASLFQNALTLTSSGGRLTAGTITVASTASITTASDLAIANTLRATSTNAVTLRSSAGSITQTAPIINSTTGSTTLNAVNSITLNDAANDFNILNLQGGATGISVSDANAVIVGTSSTTGATSITTANNTIQLGNAVTDVLSFGAALTLNAGTSTISDLSNSIFVFGALNFGGTGSVTLDALGNRFGQVNTTGTLAALDITESTTLNLGTISAGTLNAVSTNGDIVNSGAITVTGNSNFQSGNLAVPGDITLSNAANNISNGNTIFIRSARNLTLSNSSAGSTVSAVFPVLGATLFNINGNLVATGDYNMVGGTLSGSVTIIDQNDLTVQNLTVTGTSPVNITALGATSGGNLTIGSGVRISTLGLTTFTAGNTTVGSVGSITDSANGISIAGQVTFAATGGVIIDNAGHSFGRVNASSGGNNNITLVEGGTLRLGTITGSGSGVFSATSTGGSIITDAGAAIAPGTGGAIFSASTGSVTIDQFTPNGTTTVTALGNSAVTSAVNSLQFGNVVVSAGTFDATAPNNFNITQASGTTVRTFGNTSFTTSGTGGITLDNTGNNFGGLALLASGTGAVLLRESGTINIRGLTGTGAKTLTSEGGSIINGAAITSTGGILSFSAVNGSIDLSNSANNITGGTSSVRLVTNGDASIFNTGALVLQGGTNVGGALTARTGGGAGANISDAGSLTVSGNTTFDAGTAGQIQILDNNNTFGAVRFVAAGGTIVENTTFNLRAGSVSTGDFTITTAGDFITSGVGGSSFTQKLTINALGTIIPSAGSLLVVGTFTVNSPAAKNLSALSKSGNLANNDPVNLGAGAYTPPSP